MLAGSQYAERAFVDSLAKDGLPHPPKMYFSTICQNGEDGRNPAECRVPRRVSIIWFQSNVGFTFGLGIDTPPTLKKWKSQSGGGRAGVRSPQPPPRGRKGSTVCTESTLAPEKVCFCPADRRLGPPFWNLSRRTGPRCSYIH